MMKIISFISLLLCGAAAAAESSEFSGMNVLCIGCSSGIGRSTAEILLQGGAKVVVSSRTQSKCDNVVKDYDQGFAVAADAGVSEDMKALVEKSRELFHGPISHLVYAPTALAFAPLSHPDIEELASTFTAQTEINVNGLVRVLKLVHDDLIATKGAVVTVSSVAADIAMFTTPAYAAAKAAQNNLIMSLAMEVGREGVRVNTVSPAVIETPIFDLFGEARDEILEETAWRHLLGRNGQPEEVGHVIAFLLSNKASYITGQNIAVDGGFGLMNAFVDMYSSIMIPEEHRKPGHFFFAPGGYHKNKKPTVEL